MSSLLGPSFAVSSHLRPDGAPLGELPWSSSRAVVAVSFSGLFTAVALMLACLCCRKGGVGFKELENAEGEEPAADLCARDSPAAAGPDVYVLPLSGASLPMAQRPGRPARPLEPAGLGRRSLLYLEEMGHGWFGKVLLGEVSAGASSAQVVVKELKASASAGEQARFLEEAQPYRALQHSNLLRCLAQCAEATPYLLVMELCPLGDLKGYLRSCRAAESAAPDPPTLQRMACEVACGVLHLHRNNFVHSDLALRNCLLAADLTVKVGDYGLAHGRYREDYFVTADQLWVPLRWIAPELVDEVHRNLLVVGQTRASNVWSLGVTIWELFELGAQPYPHHSDRQVLAFAVREQQLKLPKPQLPLTLADRWYEVMQFCWLQPEQRPTAEEVHLLLAHLRAQAGSQAQAEADFERRWRALRPGRGTAEPAAAEPAAASSFPLLEQFAGGDEVLTVTETSRGLNLECRWEAGPARGRAGPEYSVRPEERAPAAGHDPDPDPDRAACRPGPHAPDGHAASDAPDGHDAPDARDGCASPDAPDALDAPDGRAAASLVTEPLLGHPMPAGGSWSPGLGTPCPPSRPPAPPPGAPWPSGPGAGHPDWGEAAVRPPFPEDPPGAEGPAEAHRTAQRRHWSSNVSANNNSASRARGSPPDTAQAPQAAPELDRPPAAGGPREPLLGLPVASPGQDPGPGRARPLAHQRLAPAAGPATPPGAQAAPAGAPGPDAGPRLTEEAEPVVGPWPPPPSVPSPSRAGAPLPAEHASAPATLPASPTPGAGPSAALEPADALARGSPEPGSPAQGHADRAEAAPSVLADASGPGAQRPGGVRASGAPQVQAGTPDAPPAASPSAPGTAPARGRDTGSLEPPAPVLKETHGAGVPGAFGEPAGAESPGPQPPLPAPLGGLGDKSPNRDSAYFSDLEAEPEPAPGPGEPAPGSPRGPPPPPPPASPLEPSARPADPGPLPPAPEPPAPGAEACRAEPPGPPKAPLRLALPGLPAAPEGRPEDDDGGGDSDASDEEPRCPGAPEPDSEDEAPPVPVVVAGGPGARGLRGLLKVPSLLAEALREDLERKKKAVSFFDDVTVYLFDQESPARELGEPCPGAQESPGFPAGGPGSPVVPGGPGRTHGPLERAAAPEGRSFEWADRVPPPRPEEPSPPAAPAAPKPAAPGPFSRFTVSPAPASRFSITQVADADAGPRGGPVAGPGGGREEA